MNENMISQLQISNDQALPLNDSLKQLKLFDGPDEKEKVIKQTVVQNAFSVHSKDTHNLKDFGNSFTFSQTQMIAEKQSNKLDSKANKENIENSPVISPTKVKISDTPLLKSLNASGFWDDGDDILTDSDIKEMPKKDSEPKPVDQMKSFGLDSSFMKDLFIRSEVRAQPESTLPDKNKDNENQSRPETKSLEPKLSYREMNITKNPTERLISDESNSNPAPSVKRLSFSVKNILDQKGPDLSSYLPTEALEKISKAVNRFEKSDPFQSLDQVANELGINSQSTDEQDKDKHLVEAKTELKPSVLAANLFSKDINTTKRQRK